MSAKNIAITADTSLEDLFDYAVAELRNLNSGEEVRVSDLFHGYEWSRIPIGNRTKLGSKILGYANGDGSSVIEPLGKTAQNQQIYRKK